MASYDYPPQASEATMSQAAKVLHGIILVGALLVLAVATLNITCFTQLFTLRRFASLETPYDKNSDGLNRTCQALLDIFRIRSNEKNASWKQLEGLLVKGFAFPFLVLSCLVYVLRRDSQLYLWGKSKVRTLLGGDPNMHFWTFLLVLLPCVVVTVGPQFSISDETWKQESERYREKEWQSRSILFAGVTGDAAVMALALFLVPVAKHSPLLQIFGLSFTQALVFHKVAGWVSLVFSVLHGGLYLLDYGTRLWDGPDRHREKGFHVIVREVIPPSRCWTWEALGFQSTDWGTMQNATITSPYLSGDDDDDTRFPIVRGALKANFPGHYHCNHYFFNFTGFVSMVAFLILGLFSLPYVRRRAYWLFYSCHIPMAWIMMLGVIAHISYISLFLVPNIIYYLAPTVAVWVQQFNSARQTKGVRVRSVTKITDSNGCYLLRLQGPASPPTVEEGSGVSTTFGAVCKICVPRISAIWHPFSTIRDPQNGDLLFLIRTTGPFTRNLVDFLTASGSYLEEAHEEATNRNQESLERPLLGQAEALVVEPPLLLVDGIYPAEYRWHARSLQHDAILLVAGGVGIVPFLPLLSELYRTLSMSNRSHDTLLKHVALHWYCREEGLARYICQEFLSWFLQDATGFRNRAETGRSSVDESEALDTSNITLELHIHVTSRTGDQDVQDDENFTASLLGQAISAETENNGTAMDNATVKFPDGEGRAMQKAHVASTDVWHENRRVLCWFTLLITVCSSVSWWYYGFEMHIGRGYSLLIRLHVVVLSLVMSAVFAVALIWLSSRGYARESTTSTLPFEGPGEENQPVDPSAEGAAICKRVFVTPGRPMVGDVIDPILKARQPGALFCGPTRLRHSVKQAIRRRRPSGLSPCAFYDEQSDM